MAETASKKGLDLKDPEILGLIAQMAAGSGTASPQFTAFLDKINRRLDVEDQEKAVVEEHKKRWKEFVIGKVAEARAREEANQAGCSHLKQDGNASIGGQRNMRGVMRLVCSQCNAAFTLETLPVHLRVPVQKIAYRFGGPEQIFVSSS